MKVNGDITILLFQRSVGNIIKEKKKKKEAEKRGGQSERKGMWRR